MEIFDILGNPDTLIYKMEPYGENQHRPIFFLICPFFILPPLKWMFLLLEQPNRSIETLLLSSVSLNFLQNFDVIKKNLWDFPGSSVVKNPPHNAGDVGSSLVGELGSHMPWSNYSCTIARELECHNEAYCMMQQKSYVPPLDPMQPNIFKKESLFSFTFISY